MEFGCTNSEGKIQEVDLETVIIYGRRKHSEKCHHSGFQLWKETMRFFLPRYYGRQNSRLWPRLSHKTVNHFGTWEANLLLGSEKWEAWESLCKAYLGGNNCNEVKNNEWALSEHFWKNAADQILVIVACHCSQTSGGVLSIQGSYLEQMFITVYRSYIGQGGKYHFCFLHFSKETLL